MEFFSEGLVTNNNYERTMKEDLIGEGLQTSEKTVKSQRSVVFSMVHIIPLVVIWLAQPGTSKLSKNIPSSIKLIHSVVICSKE